MLNSLVYVCTHIDNNQKQRHMELKTAEITGMEDLSIKGAEEFVAASTWTPRK
jgi:hypothetical protein